MKLRKGNPKTEGFSKGCSRKKLFYKILQMSEERTFDEDLSWEVAVCDF